MHFAVQPKLGARLVEQLPDVARRQGARDGALFVKSCRRAEPANAHGRTSQLGDGLVDERRVDSDFRRDLLNLADRALRAASVRTLLQLGRALEDERHLLFGVALTRT